MSPAPSAPEGSRGSQSPNRPWATTRAILRAARRTAFLPALISTFALWRGLHEAVFPAVPWMVEGVIALAALFFLWLLALVAGAYAGLLGCLASRRARTPERSSLAGAAGLWVGCALAAQLPSGTLENGALGAATVVGPVAGSRLAAIYLDRALAWWNARWQGGDWWSRRLRVGPDGRLDLRGVVGGALAGLLAAAVALSGVFDHLEAILLTARESLRNERWWSPMGSVDLSSWLRLRGARASLDAVILTIDEPTATEILQRSSEFAVSRAVLEKLLPYGPRAAVVLLADSSRPAEETMAAAGLRPGYPAVDERGFARLAADMPALARVVSGSDRVLLTLFRDPVTARLEPGHRMAVAPSRWNPLRADLWRRARWRATLDLEPHLVRQLQTVLLGPRLGVQSGPVVLAQRLLGRPPPAARERALVNVYGSAPGAVFQHISYASLLAGDRVYDRRRGEWVPPEEFFRDRVVYLDSIDQTGLETPIGTLPLGELFAMATDNVLTGKALSSPGAGLTLLLLPSCGAVGGHLALRHRPAAGALRLLAVGVGIVIGSLVAFIIGDLWVPLIACAVSALAGYVLVLNAAHAADLRELDDQRQERAALEQSLAISRAIQASLLPADHLDAGDFRVRCSFEPAQAVGGDFYNLFALEDGRIALALGDVAGHGVRGAMYMTVATTLLEARAAADRGPGEVLADLNARLHPKIRRLRMFVSLFYGVLDPATGRLEWATAGQMPPVLLDATGNARFLPGQGSPLGAMAQAQYRTMEHVIAPGESLLVASDGFVEARGGDGRMLGYPQLVAAVQQLARAGREQIGERLVQWLKELAQSELDDLTLLVVHRQPAPTPVDMTAASEPAAEESAPLPS